MTTKNLTELTAELAILEDALADTRKVANGRATASYLVQSMQTKVLLGNATQAELLQAQADVDKAVEALTRIPTLEASVASQRQLIEATQHRDRANYVQSLKDEFTDVYARYTQRSKDVLGLFKELQRIDLQYRSLATSGYLPCLLDQYHLELNLPAVTGSLASRSGYATGSGQ